MHVSRFLKGGLLAILVAGSLPAQVRLKPADEFTLVRLKAQKEARAAHFLDPSVKALARWKSDPDPHSFKANSVDVDQFGRTVATYDHHWNGIRIAGASTVAILDKDDQVEGIRHAFKDLLEPPSELRTPKISAKDAEKAAWEALRARPGNAEGGISQGWQELVLEPQIERVTIPWPSLWAPASGAGDPTRTVRTLKGWKLVHHIHHLTKGGREAYQTRIDAMTGELLSSIPTHSCAPTTLIARSQYYRQGGSTQVPFQGEAFGSTYALQRGNLFGVHIGDVLNPVYTSSLPTFGDGSEYTWGNPWTSPNGQTQAADLMIGLNKAYDFYRSVYGRNHIDGSNGYYVATAAHQENLGDPARAWWYRNMWGQESYWIDFRSRLNPSAPGGPTELSVTAHEWSHLVNFRSARVGREGSDSFGAHAVNEGMSTILGTACRLWDSTGSGGGIGYPDPSRWKFDWSYEPQVYGSQPWDSNVNAVEYLYRPSKPGVWEPSWWNIGDYGVNGDPHRAAAPLHRAFYFLANGAQPIRNRYDESDEERGRTSPFMPWGFNGLGAHNAALVFYQALTQTMHQSTDLQQSAYDLIAAGDQLFGAGSPSAKAVRKALAAVNLITPETYSLPWTTSPNTPSSATTVPNEESFFQLSGSLDSGDGAYHLRVTLPPYGTILFSATSGFPSLTQVGEALGVEIRNSDGSMLLASAEPAVDYPYDLHPIETPTVDPMPEPPPQPDAPTTASAWARFTNTGGSPYTILIKLRSAQARTEGTTYISNGIVQFREFIEQPGGAVLW